MEIHDEYIPEELFTAFTEHLPQICVEIVVQRQESILLVERSIEPAKGEWFWPGSRLYKGEELEAAAHRVAAQELGIEVRIVRQLGVYSHLWETSAAAGSPSRHTVNVVYLVEPLDQEPEITLDEQHTTYRWITELTEDYHEYVEQYIEENNLL